MRLTTLAGRLGGVGRGRWAAVGTGLAAMAAAASPALATDWLEPRDNDLDAGEFVSDAAVPVGMGELESITGELSQFGGFGPGGGDGQDLVKVYIPNPTLFSARVVTEQGFQPIDAQLFLFDEAGFGLLANDEAGPMTALPHLLPVATDGSFALTTPGIYVIGIAGSGNFPVSGSASPIFMYTATGEISGPDGVGGGAPHSAWAGPETYGRYRIELTGTFYVPAPGTAGLFGLAGLAVARRRRRRM